jgi:hypothetical protein
MLQRIGGVLVVVAVLLPRAATAVVPGGGAAADDADLVVTERALVREQPRRQVTTTASRPLRARAWQHFVARGGTWNATWDAATKVPSRIWGSGFAAPGSSGSPEVAAAWARATLAAHIDLLAPGARLDDFVVVSNQVVGDVRVVGLAQRHLGLRVLGGQVSFRFKRDRLFVIGSEALPDIRVAAPAAKRSLAQKAALAVRTRDATVHDLGLRAASAGASGDAAILPIVGDAAVLGYRVVTPVDIDAGAEGRWTVFADDAGLPIARAPRRQYATGMLYYNAITRYPGTPRFNAPARRARITVNGQAMTAGADGEVTWSPDAQVAVVTTATGETVAVTNKAGAAAGAQLTLTPGSETVWADESALVDAQIQGFVHTLIAKEYVRTHLADLPFLAQPMVVNVNLDDECNAFYDGESINFFRSSDRCQNTALIADVIYHEFGHALHHAALVEGVGRMDGALSEGMADFFAGSITGDPGMGRGFFRDDEALRHIDDPVHEAIWPRDVGEIHTTGIIFAGAMWDLRKAFIAQLGEDAGIALVNRLFLAAIRTSTNIPSTLVEVLAADDDDGDLGNGTPNDCTIKSVFARHGLHTTTGIVEGIGAVTGSPAAPRSRSPTTAATRSTSSTTGSSPRSTAPTSRPIRSRPAGPTAAPRSRPTAGSGDHPAAAPPAIRPARSPATPSSAPTCATWTAPTARRARRGRCGCACRRSTSASGATCACSTGAGSRSRTRTSIRPACWSTARWPGRTSTATTATRAAPTTWTSSGCSTTSR